MLKHIDTTVPPGAKTSAGDVNGDGKADFVVRSSDGTTLTVLLGNGDGTTTTGQTLSPVGGVTATALGDVNGDGKLDLAIANSTGTGVTVALGNGDGTFLAPGPSIAAGAVALALGDLNGDGRADLVTLGSGIGVVRLANADGSFSPPFSTFSAITPGALAIGDVTGDGKADIVAAGATSAGAVGVVAFAGRGDGGLGDAQYVGAIGTVTDIALGDLNADGRLDIAAASITKGNGFVSVFVNEGNGAYLRGGFNGGDTYY